jgi:hypothetical protein
MTRLTINSMVAVGLIALTTACGGKTDSATDDGGAWFSYQGGMRRITLYP